MKPLVLIIMDGWGLTSPSPGNAISQSRLVHIPRLWNTYPHTSLQASGLAVGLPDNEDGNTETGHINIGAGRVVFQDLVRINTSISDKSFFQNDAFLGAIRHAKNHSSNIHLIGLYSDAGVHASRAHLCALLELLKREECQRVYLHLFTDGRDAPPTSALGFFKESHDICQTFPFAKVATIMGRYYGMDRDLRWERTHEAYDALTEGAPFTAATVEEAIQMAYDRGETDEFIKPTTIKDEQGSILPRIQNSDSIIFYNYRVDRPRQLTRAFTMPDFETNGNIAHFDPYSVKYTHTHIPQVASRDNPFTRDIILKNLFFATMTEYEPNTNCVVAYPQETVSFPFGKVISDAHVRQLRMAESEKERFVTYYFNGMREQPYPGEDRLIVPSPKVATYDMEPKMSAHELTEQLIERLTLNIYGVIVINLANADMVGHTGNIEAAIKACETVDFCVGKIVDAVLSLDGTCVITADHGNVEEMIVNQMIDTEHSTFPVPFIVVNKKFEGNSIVMHTGKLADIAPTCIALIGLSKPSEMTGTNLLL